tara:strand:+ start:20445 stop:20891 length:447 start_codon:yes stop_codon:yes gene_type:complete
MNNAMLRVLAITILIAAGLPRLGVGLVAGQDHCGDTICHEPVIDMGCCGDSLPDECSDLDCGSEAFCPVSEGPCKCGISETPAPDRLPDAPLPRTDRDSPTGLPNGPPKITPVIEPDDSTPSMVSLVAGLRTGKTHNEVQALLGVWQT